MQPRIIGLAGLLYLLHSGDFHPAANGAASIVPKFEITYSRLDAAIAASAFIQTSGIRRSIFSCHF
jgi:hypothetical protein